MNKNNPRRNFIKKNLMMLFSLSFLNFDFITNKLKKRDLISKLVRRRGRVYIINKTNPKFKARQK